MPKDVCIICAKEVAPASAAPVAWDPMLTFLRRGKTLLKMAQNNRLYVCADCRETHAKRRAGFEKTFRNYAILAGVVVVGVLLLPLLGPWDLGQVLVSLAVGLLLAGFLLALTLTRYVPAVSGADNPSAPGTTPSPPAAPPATPNAQQSPGG